MERARKLTFQAKEMNARMSQDGTNAGEIGTSCFAVAVLAFLLGQNSRLLWPAALIAGGAAIILVGIFRKSGTKSKE
jgi:hypothetical protein